MTGYTPGPWKVFEWHDGHHIELDYDPPGLTWPTVGIVNQEADARLIAAAPELLEALERLSALAEIQPHPLGCSRAYYVAETGAPACECGSVEAWQLADRAIAKVRAQAVLA